jgi:hypothetical protein
LASMALSLIGEVMNWDDAEATAEYAFLRMMSSIKYDGYADFRAGVRFVESLAVWLKQFEPEERRAAYGFFKSRLVYISPPELQCLIDLFFPEIVTPTLRTAVANQLGIRPYEVWGSAQGAQAFKSALRRTLFVGMSDGSRTDMLRRANSGRISPEQVVPTLVIDDDKWASLAEELVKDEGPDARFDRVFLVEDFTASGTTFIRKKNGIWKGKLWKFQRRAHEARENWTSEFPFPLGEPYSLQIHHYISSSQARDTLLRMIGVAEKEWVAERGFSSIDVTEGLLLPTHLKMSHPDDKAILELCDKYHDPLLDEKLAKHLKESGIDSVKYGYGECALPVILDHNTPNNSISLLWAQTCSMEPLFRRRDRHG